MGIMLNKAYFLSAIALVAFSISLPADARLIRQGVSKSTSHKSRKGRSLLVQEFENPRWLKRFP